MEIFLSKSQKFCLTECYRFIELLSVFTAPSLCKQESDNENEAEEERRVKVLLSEKDFN
jgi:hypothetical protein